MTIPILWLSFIFVISGIAQEPRYPGSERRLEDVAQSAEGFCIAEFESLGTPDAGSPGSTYYSNAVLKIKRNLADEKFKALSCSYSVQTYPESAKEDAPTVGKTFLMLGSFSGETFNVTKLVEPTDSNVGLVEQVLRARGIEINRNINAPSEKPQDAANPQEVRSISASPVERAVKAPKAQSPQLASAVSSPTIPWRIIAVVTVAGLGLLWLLLKRRS